MKIAYLSDYHREFDQNWVLPVPDADVLVLAGDISAGVNAIQWGQTLARQRPGIKVVQVAGNHEHYRQEIKKNILLMRKEASKNQNHYFLENNSIDIDGVRFVGATLWTDFSHPTGAGAGRDFNMAVAPSLMNDYRMIKYQYGPDQWGKLSPANILNTHVASREYIFSELNSRPHNLKAVVVTHHAPSGLSVGERYKGDSRNCYYVSDLDDRIKSISAPDLWLHGHIHSPSDYMIGSTRVVCNPIGYPGELPNSEIKIVEI